MEAVRGGAADGLEPVAAAAAIEDTVRATVHFVVAVVGSAIDEIAVDEDRLPGFLRHPDTDAASAVGCGAQQDGRTIARRKKVVQVAETVGSWVLARGF